MLEKIVHETIKGFEIDKFTVYAKAAKTGRFKEEVILPIHLREDIYEENLLFIRVYYGMDPYHKPWVEFYGINSSLKLEKGFYYFDSTIEEKLLGLFSNALPPGGKIYVQYDNDIETSYGLTYRFPPIVTRIGFKLFNLGFTWFKDWYFPEGGSEGGQKLQGEKPLNYEARDRHLRGLRKEIKPFIERAEGEKKMAQREYQKYWIRAKIRAETILSKKK